MRQDPITRILECARQLASEQCGDVAPLEPMLHLHGRHGEAVLRLDFTDTAALARLLDKARLMATAVSADASAFAFESRLQLPRGASLPVVAVIAGSGGPGAVRLYLRAPAGSGAPLRPLANGLVGPRLPGTLAGILDRLLPGEPSDLEIAQAWRQLEAMGTNVQRSGRPLH